MADDLVYRPKHDPLRPGLLMEIDGGHAPSTYILIPLDPLNIWRDSLRARKLGLKIRLCLMGLVAFSAVVVPWFTAFPQLCAFVYLGGTIKRDLAAIREIRDRIEPAQARLLKEKT